MNTFEIEAVELLKVEKVLIGHDSDCPGDGWFLKKIIIWDKRSPGEMYAFYVDRYGA